MANEFSKREKAQLKELAQEAWEAELHEALEALFEDFCRWADKGYSSFELSERIHEFHNGVSQELYKRYALLPPPMAVSHALAHHIVDRCALTRHFLKNLHQASRRCGRAMKTNSVKAPTTAAISPPPRGLVL